MLRSNKHAQVEEILAQNPTSLQLNSMLLNYYSLNKLNSPFESLLKRMHTLATLKFDSRIYQTLLFHYRDLSIVPPTHTCDAQLNHTILTILLETDQLEKGIQVCQQTENAALYRTLFKYLLEKEHYDQIIQLFFHVPRKILPIYNQTLQASFMSSSDSFYTVWDMLVKHSHPNVVSYTLLLRMKMKALAIPKIMDILAEMKTKKFVVEQDLLLEIFVVCLDTKNAHCALKLLPLLTCDISSALAENKTAMLEHYLWTLDLNHHQNCVIVIDFYKRCGLNLLKPLTFVHAMKAFRNQDDLIGLVGVWSQYEKLHTPTAQAVESLLEACSYLGKKSTASAVCQMVQKKGYEMTVKSYDHVLFLACKYQSLSLVCHAALDRSNAAKLDSTTYRLMIVASQMRDNEFQRGLRAFLDEHFPDIIMDETVPAE